MEASSTRDREPAVEDVPMPGESTDLEVVHAAAPPTYRGVVTDDELRRHWRLASALAQSGMFPDATEAPKALAKILMGRDLGLSPTQAMQGIHIVEGKPQLHYATMGGFVRSREGYDYRKKRGEDGKVLHTAELCVVEFTRDNWATVEGESEFSIEDAKTAGLKFTTSSGAPTNWTKRPKVMLFARALSQGVRDYMPEVLGGVPVYVEGEIEAEAPRLIAGSGEAEGLDLGPKVEEVLIRAEALGHQGIADRAVAEMALGSQSPQVVDQWVGAKHAELDTVDPELCRSPAEDGRICVMPVDHDPPHKARQGEPWTDDEKPDAEAPEGEDGAEPAEAEPVAEAEEGAK